MRLILLCLALSGCASVRQDVKTNVFYQRDIKVCDDNQDCQVGVGVFKTKSEHKFWIKSQGNIDLGSVATCHREFLARDTHSDFNFDYVPSPGMEDIADCPMQVTTFDKSKGRNGWGFFVFEHPARTLPATMYCNGVVTKADGASICQSRVGFKEAIEFDREVYVSPDPECELRDEKGTLPNKAKRFAFFLPPHICGIIFKDAVSGQIHRMTTVAYEDILL